MLPARIRATQASCRGRVQWLPIVRPRTESSASRKEQLQQRYMAIAVTILTRYDKKIYRVLPV